MCVCLCLWFEEGQCVLYRVYRVCVSMFVCVCVCIMRVCVCVCVCIVSVFCLRCWIASRVCWCLASLSAGFWENESVYTVYTCSSGVCVCVCVCVCVWVCVCVCAWVCCGVSFVCVSVCVCSGVSLKTDKKYACMRFWFGVCMSSRVCTFDQEVGSRAEQHSS